MFPGVLGEAWGKMLVSRSRSGFQTLQQHKDEGSTLYAWCHDPICGHGDKLDLDQLIEQFGPDFEVSAFTINHRLKCTKCGSAKGFGCGIKYSPGRKVEALSSTFNWKRNE